MWLLYALSGPIFWAASIHIDKYILQKYFKHGSVAVSMVFTAIIGLLMLPFLAIFVRGIFSLDVVSIAVMIASGLLYMGGLLFYLYALQSEEASVVAMLSPVGPIIVYALAYFFWASAYRQLRCSAAVWSSPALFWPHCAWAPAR